MAKAEYHYGWHAVEGILAEQPEIVLGLFLQKGRSDERSAVVSQLAKHNGIAIQQASKDGLSKLAGTDRHQGIVVSTRIQPMLNEDDLAALLLNKSTVCLLILDQVTDPHNLGACMRSSAALGVDAVVTTKDRAASLTPTVRKVAAGAAEVIPFIQVTNLARTLDFLKEQGVWVVGTLLDAQAKPLHECALTGKIALVMGAEDTGLRRLTQAACDQLAYIPMSGKLQSLNVSVACGIALYETMRQRHA